MASPPAHIAVAHLRVHRLFGKATIDGIWAKILVSATKKMSVFSLILTDLVRRNW